MGQWNARIYSPMITRLSRDQLMFGFLVGLVWMATLINKVWKFESLKVYYYTQQPILGIGVHYKYIETYFTIAIQQYIRIALQDVQNNNHKNK